MTISIAPTLPRKSVRPIRIDGDIGIISLTRGFEARIDADDAHLIDGRNWSSVLIGRKVKRVYAAVGLRVGDGYRLAYLHRVITGCGLDVQIDHIDGDTLNNTKSNLRVCNSAQNTWNSAPSRRSKTGLKGVFPSYRYPGTYRFSVTKQGKVFARGDQLSLADAVAAYDAAAKDAFGEFAYINTTASSRMRVVA